MERTGGVVNTQIIRERDMNNMYKRGGDATRENRPLRLLGATRSIFNKKTDVHNSATINF